MAKRDVDTYLFRGTTIFLGFVCLFGGVRQGGEIAGGCVDPTRTSRKFEDGYLLVARRMISRVVFVDLI